MAPDWVLSIVKPCPGQHPCELGREHTQMLSATAAESGRIPCEDAISSVPRAVRRGGTHVLSSPLEGWLASILGLPLWTKPCVGVSPCLCPVERAWAFVSWSFSTSCSGQVLVSLFPRHPSHSTGWPSIRTSCCQIPHPHLSAGPPAVFSRGTTHTLSHTWGHTQHRATYLLRPA